MDKFGTYVDYLEGLVADLTVPGEIDRRRSAIDSALDGQPARELRRLVPISELRANGAFFTGSQLARKALRSTLRRVTGDKIVLDPACGAGDLLVACAMQMPLGTTLSATLADWGKRIIGRDIHPQFVAATKLRLVLAALRRGVPNDGMTLARLTDSFPRIEARCGLGDHQALAAASDIILNPPFTMAAAPPDCKWGGGDVNSAAMFLDSCVTHAKAGARIVAILPEVLRSGSRYCRWRTMIESKVKLRRIELSGRFDRWADVNVFVVELELKRKTSIKPSRRWTQHTRTVPERFSDYFDISVGAVVPHRDPNRGPWFSYIYSRSVPPWATVSDIQHRRRFAGRTFRPPFVVVRRTSGPNDQYRAVASVIQGKDPVAVENHLMVLKPTTGGMKRCQRALTVLKSNAVNEWLNQRICCRHLTVTALRDLPWKGDNDG